MAQTYDSNQWYQCKVDKAGPAEDGTIYISLNCPGNFSCWFSATEGMKKEMLSVALTAITTNLKVEVQVTGTIERGKITRMYLCAH